MILFLQVKSTYETYFAPLGLEAHVEFKSKYGKGEPTDVMIDALLADFRKTDCDRIIAIGGGAVIDMANPGACRRLHRRRDLWKEGTA